MEIRQAQVEDAALIAALNIDVQSLHAEALPSMFKQPSEGSFPVNEVEELIRTPGCYFYLAYLDGQPVGYLYAEVRDQPETLLRRAFQLAYIHHISVRPEARHHGVGGALIERACQLAQEHEIETVALDVWAFNTTAQEFFGSQGFEPYNVRMWKHL